MNLYQNNYFKHLLWLLGGIPKFLGCFFNGIAKCYGLTCTKCFDSVALGNFIVDIDSVHFVAIMTEFTVPAFFHNKVPTEVFSSLAVSE